ncbi:hypothetical protein GYMLUDRAFT_252459 [Collybiopsis luxurians FD-317 M1]|uniref:Unplaced genomic scaffold GYMLUscaffold_128, whole genome shotgun sequence n=1 Tax=Collybiopsis luxurians FD-317 M1 TaxID=944289 RepID=A0A0D0BND9_9AGAR|nr:hypothetical protein GYMLUDRAFT_252459 [Collybiopsis luxurians FD-317 M1]
MSEGRYIQDEILGRDNHSLQKDWADHKALCKALHKIDDDPDAKKFLLYDLSKAPLPSSDFDLLNDLSLSQVDKLQIVILSSFKPSERDNVKVELVFNEPRCLACTRTDRLLRMETGDPSATLKSCPDCHLAFFCSDEHWNVVSHKHTSEPFKYGYDGLSQCAINRNIPADIQLASIKASDFRPGSVFKKIPKKIPFREKWEPLLDEPAWEAEFWKAMRVSAGGDRIHVDAILRAISEELSYPMTILYMLQKLNKGEEWTKDTLSIHLLGASLLKEATFGDVFEEILHHLPQVKTLKLLLCNPDLYQEFKEGDIVCNLCGDCESRGRKLLVAFAPEKYHEYVQKQKSKSGDGFRKPDLAIAFNSGMSSFSLTKSWTDTVEVLVHEKILTVFTSYSKLEAELDYAILRQEGADLLLGPQKNPWSSQVLSLETDKVAGYSSSNGWIAAAFIGQGRPDEISL